MLAHCYVIDIFAVSGIIPANNSFFFKKAALSDKNAVSGAQSLKFAAQAHASD